jgi:diacylglycerol kinase family enzyme
MGLNDAHYFFNMTPEGAHARVAHETKNWQLVEVAFKAYKSEKVKARKNKRGVAW